MAPDEETPQRSTTQMETFENSSVREYSIWKTKGYDDFIDEWALMTSHIPVTLLVSAYLIFVLKLGPDYMSKRQPFALNNILLVYNIFQVALSVFVFQYGARLLIRQGLVGSICEKDRQNLEPLAVGIYYYLSAKITELLDTVFFVLRKKYNQVSFLHVYHHALTLSATWYILKYEPTTSIVFLGTINSLVHIVMYSYYALSTFPALTKYLWWKKYITTMQLVQFGLIIIQISANTYITGCPPSYFLLGVVLSNVLLMIYLFSDFYSQSYSNNGNKYNIKNSVQNTQKSDDKRFTNLLNHKSSHEKIH